MFPRVKRVRHICDYRLELTFTDRATAEFEFRQRVVGRGGVFSQLEDVGFSGRFRWTARRGQSSGLTE